MLNSKYIKIVYKNKVARELFGLTKSLLSTSVKSSKLFDNATFTLLDSKKEVLYAVFDKPITFKNSLTYLIKIELEKNEMSTVGLYSFSSNEKLNLKYAQESVFHDYIRNHDRNISGMVGNTDYI